MKYAYRALAALTSVTLMLSALLTFSGCSKEEASSKYEKNKDLDTSKPIELVIATTKQSWPEMDAVTAGFQKIYPNCTVVCEYIEEYTTNIGIRLQQTEDKIDIFRTTNIQESTEYKDNALNLISEESKKILDLSGTNTGLVNNFRYNGDDTKQLAIPFGGEMRGMYVNVTLLKQNGLEVPKNRAEFLHCCEVLHTNGYIPIQSSSGTLAQQLLYPYICNSIVNGGNYEKTYAALENIEPGVSEYFRDAYSFLYDIVEKGYFDYKRVETELGYAFSSVDMKAKEFLNILPVSDDLYEKKDDIGKIAFLCDTQGFGLDLAKTKSDYHSEIEYKFILSPVGVDGGYAYLSPADGLAINNQSDNIDWSLEFLNYFFTPEISTQFAEATGKIPNTPDALLKYDVPEGHSCDVGQVTFSYSFYKVVTKLMLDGYDDMIGISKMNAEKYMQKNDDGTYSPKYSLEDYLDRLEQEFQKVKQEREQSSE